jgi:glycosyltransferase involved in cell wall biosynthesis
MTGKQDTVSVVIPAYNEVDGVAGVVEHLKEVLSEANLEYEIIIVDDGSTDGTPDAAHKAGAHVIQHEENRGYGASLKTGICSAQYDEIVITDADGTYPCEVIPDLLEKLKDADLVMGARVGSNTHIPLVRRPAKWVLAKLAEYIAGEKIVDLNSGLRAFRRETVLPYFNILSDKFSFTTTQLLSYICDHYKIVNVPIDYHPRKGKSKIVPWDFVNFITLVLRMSMLFNPLKVFVPTALFCLGLGVVKFVLDIVFAFQRAGGLSWGVLMRPTVSTTTLILVLTGVQILLIGMMSDGLSRKIGHFQGNPMASHMVRDLDRMKRNAKRS